MSRGFSTFQPGLYDNDWAGDCTSVALFNCARGAALVQTGADIPVAPGAPLNFYAATVGVPPNRQAIQLTDGTTMLATLDRAASVGVDFGQQVPLVPLAKAIDTDNRFALASALTLGPLYLGVGLALADQEHTTWSTTTPGNQTKGSWGGHALMAWDYEGLGDSDTVRLGTWGLWQNATWAWLHERLDEAYTLSWPQLARAY